MVGCRVFGTAGISGCALVEFGRRALTVGWRCWAVDERWLSLEGGRWLLEEGGLSMVLVAVRVGRLSGGDVEEDVAGEPESELLTGEAEEVELVIEVDLAAVDERWLSLIEVDLAAVDERWLGLEGGR